jgi:hypothetical protein
MKILKQLALVVINVAPCGRTGGEFVCFATIRNEHSSVICITLATVTSSLQFPTSRFEDSTHTDGASNGEH